VPNLLRKNKFSDISSKQSSACRLLHARCLLGLLLDTEDASSTFLRNISGILPDYTASHSRSYYPSDFVLFFCFLIRVILAESLTVTHRKAIQDEQS
jgi:hypothetical protein